MQQLSYPFHSIHLFWLISETHLNVYPAKSSLSSLSSERQWSTSWKLCRYSVRPPGTEREQRGGLEAPRPPWCPTTSGPPCAWLSAWWERALCTQPPTAGTWTRCWLTSARGRWKEGQNEGRSGEGWSSVSVLRWEVNVWVTERNQSGYAGGRHCELSTILQRPWTTSIKYCSISVDLEDAASSGTVVSLYFTCLMAITFPLTLLIWV